MNTEKTWQTQSSSSEDTSKIGELLGSACKGGEVIVLNSDLGGGKTTFVKGLAKGLGSLDKVGSPSFTINKMYKCSDDKTLQHFDFYRLVEPGIVSMELAEFINDPKTVVVIEWGDIIKSDLPKDRIEVYIEQTPDDENARQIKITYTTRNNYLMEKLR